MHKQNERLTANLHLHISPRLVFSWLFAIVVTFTAISVASDLIRFRDGHRSKMTWWMALFNLDRPLGVPTFFKGILLFVCAAALAAIALHQWRQRDSFRFHWAALAMIFLYLSLDEMCALHNQLETMMKQRGGGDGGAGTNEYHGVWHYSWVIPALACLALVGVAYLWFVFRLPSATRTGVILSFVLCVGGAVGLEMLGGWLAERIGGEELGQNLPCALLANLEEFTEMLGLTVFLHTLLNYKMEFVPHLLLQVGDANPNPNANAPALAGPHHHLSGPARRAAGVHGPTRGSRRVGKIEVSVHVRPRGTRTDKFADAQETSQ